MVEIPVRCVLLGLWALRAQAAPEGDRVAALPGWDAPLFSNTYSGYIQVGSKDGAAAMYEHYLFFESEVDPTTDPIIMWTNGGPGASSFFGSFSELGPYYLTQNSMTTEGYSKTGVPTLYENSYRWTKLGNLLIRNLPPPIGFSYCDPAGPSGDGYSCGPWNDSVVARHSYEFINNWMEAFSEHKNQDLYLVGESYAGVYVPMLAREILAHGPGGVASQLKGVAVGDGCTTGLGCLPLHGPHWTVEFFYGHGQFSTKTYKEIQAACSQGEQLVNGVKDAACKQALDRMDEETGYSFDYNLYDECYDFALAAPPRRWSDGLGFGPPTARGQLHPPGGGPAAAQDWHADGSPCGGTAVLPHWANTPAVKQALHVAEDAHFFTGDNGVGFTYIGSEPDLAPSYKHMAENTDLRVLIYNGDTDPGLNSFVGENWTSALGLPVREPWRPWTRDGQKKMGGYVTRYVGDLDYLTIRGSGHMVPEYKPEAAFVFMKHFLGNQEYPRYVKPSVGQQHVRFV